MNDVVDSKKDDSQEYNSPPIIDPEKKALDRLLNLLERQTDEEEENDSRKSKRRTIKKI